ncbi:hypothetical protein TUZN_2232 [Thermoproteus uzoniensis 768-20]|uniref:Uncharacterized protein n=1 Tax=Thermoproteus uzoniensis (strain 768-20) TaxID=999630 RepID=F2L670_THEU7|nr:hypothetical protein TUZN_2232 [Thermoproteus uzoniensis 768-20]
MTKLAIAAEADAFTGNFIAPRLRDDLMKRIQEIETQSITQEIWN